jgi:hypothetical protein
MYGPNNAREPHGIPMTIHTLLHTISSPNTNPHSICLKQVAVATENDVQFANPKPVTALYDTGASHSFISKSCAMKLGVDVDSFPQRKLIITVGNNRVGVEYLCSEIPLIVKLRKTFDNSTSIDTLVSVKTTFLVYESGHHIHY